MNDTLVLACEGLVKEFRQGPALVRVLKGVNAAIRRASASRSSAPPDPARRRCCSCWAASTCRLPAAC